MFSAVAIAVVAATAFVVALVQREAERQTRTATENAAALRASVLDEERALRHLADTGDPGDRRIVQRQRGEFENALDLLRRGTPSAGEEREIARAEDFARRWRAAADAVLAQPGAEERLNRDAFKRHRELDSFLTASSALQSEQAKAADGRRLRATLLPAGMVLALGAALALLHLLAVERPVHREARRRERQARFVETLQAARSETEAYRVLARHVEGTVPGSSVTVLNTNNSSDRLEAATSVPPDSPLSAGLQGTAPDGCLAIRLGRSQERRPDDADALLTCEVCGDCPTRTLCTPSLVGGEVVGALVLEHSRPLPPDGREQVETSVAEAAPVIANLRNLAIAELRAATDALTGLPNHRAVHETLKRMVAQAGRTLQPLSVVLFDLDHFKAVNDTFGHHKGDEVLAAVGYAISSTVRSSDLAGRLGGEEFAVLLPAADRDAGAIVAEKLRVAISHLNIPGVERDITASFGVAALPEDAGETAALLRAADRALYAAKQRGRNRVVTVDVGLKEDSPGAGAAADELPPAI